MYIYINILYIHTLIVDLSSSQYKRLPEGTHFALSVSVVEETLLVHDFEATNLGHIHIHGHFKD